jgi:DNA primase
VDEKIVSLIDEASLKAELIPFLIKHYEREYKKVNLQTSISFEEKAFYIRKFKDKVLRLKKGELVPFKS